MKKVIAIIIVFFSCSQQNQAKEYIFEVYGESKLDTIKISKNYKFSTYTSKGMWDDSEGDYGNEICVGYVKQLDDNVELEIYCETSNQHDETFWNSRIRKSNKGAGVGQMNILNATGKYKDFIGLVCPYGVNYKKQYAWLRAECKVE
ncbi:MAG: hypothetical protein CMP24_03955 [Rickettsiales bacterium]|nr:hypothetical protein [Rickettsiales bacterium]|tara:strand:- start:298 stop:738 length:441 start_codon:yes stop_codon:yes gene_type:complete